MPPVIVECILEEVKRLTVDEQRELREALAREPRPAPAYDTHERERGWIESHRDEYLDQWVALDGDRLLAHGGVVVPYVERVKPNDGLLFGGW